VLNIYTANIYPQTRLKKCTAISICLPSDLFKAECSPPCISTRAAIAPGSVICTSFYRCSVYRNLILRSVGKGSQIRVFYLFIYCLFCEVVSTIRITRFMDFVDFPWEKYPVFERLCFIVI
jgi:hypothetical protein